MGLTYFSPDLFHFLNELKQNNRRDWFIANKERYEKSVRQPFLRFIADLGPHLKKISSRLVADPRPTGGSMFRIYRDVRFSEDKSPYKTMAAAHFYHQKADKMTPAPGFYLHLEPSACFSGGGLWHPDPKTVNRIRSAILQKPQIWKKARGKKLEGSKLTRPPKGFPSDHPLIEDLKHKDFIQSVTFTEEQVCSQRFLSDFVSSCKKMSPLMQFLTRALGLPW